MQTKKPVGRSLTPDEVKAKLLARQKLKFNPSIVLDFGLPDPEIDEFLERWGYEQSE
jgi:hypothetical protein